MTNTIRMAEYASRGDKETGRVYLHYRDLVADIRKVRKEVTTALIEDRPVLASKLPLVKNMSTFVCRRGVTIKEALLHYDDLQTSFWKDLIIADSSKGIQGWNRRGHIALVAKALAASSNYNPLTGAYFQPLTRKEDPDDNEDIPLLVVPKSDDAIERERLEAAIRTTATALTQIAKALENALADIR